MARHRRLNVMVRLDRTIGLPTIVLTRVVWQMVRSSRTMTVKRPCHGIGTVILAPMAPIRDALAT